VPRVTFAQRSLRGQCRPRQRSAQNLEFACGHSFMGMAAAAKMRTSDLKSGGSHLAT